jgi:hypothetical protein
MSIGPMDELDFVALKNLMLLSKNRDNEGFQWYVVGPEIRAMDTDTYDTIHAFQDLEYPLFFTFHQLFRFTDDPNRLRFNKHSTKDILSLMEDMIETCYRMLNRSEEGTDATDDTEGTDGTDATEGTDGTDGTDGTSDREEEDITITETLLGMSPKLDLEEETGDLRETQSRNRLLCMLQDFDDRHSCAYERYHSESICVNLMTTISETFDDIVVGFSEAKRYLYITPLKEE